VSVVRLNRLEPPTFPWRRGSQPVCSRPASERLSPDRNSARSDVLIARGEPTYAARLGDFFPGDLNIGSMIRCSLSQGLVEHRQNVALDFRIPRHTLQPTGRRTETTWLRHNEPEPRVPTKSNFLTDPCHSNRPRSRRSAIGGRQKFNS
jgi:hypothetical protein